LRGLKIGALWDKSGTKQSKKHKNNQTQDTFLRKLIRFNQFGAQINQNLASFWDCQSNEERAAEITNWSM